MKIGRAITLSDWTKFNEFGPNGKEYYWKRKNEPLIDCHVKNTVKYGSGSVIVWDMYEWKKVGN